MSEANGQPHAGPTPSEADAAFNAALAWLPYWSDRQRGKLRARLIDPRLVRREGVTPKPKEPIEGNQ